MTATFINAIATAVPDFDIHAKFINYCPRLLLDERHIPISPDWRNAHT